jgi:hypothetical protein
MEKPTSDASLIWLARVEGELVELLESDLVFADRKRTLEAN